ncbi:GSU2403 family nucleotidyltransferase fold protein [Burkholderia sp. 22PA0106]|uniref:GSU2403 family nucleotidyltransferase fold protein n=1 Tax=Burkholderia sp. 22PA0106 TaxID=3237371 RepID=UPI0039C2665E
MSAWTPFDPGVAFPGNSLIYKGFPCRIQKNDFSRKSMDEPQIVPLSGNTARQYIDACAAFKALEQARKDAKTVRGTMYWREKGGNEYLIRQTGGNRQISLGPRSEKTDAIHQKFVQRKASVEARLQKLKTTVAEHERMNRALRVGRAPRMLVSILNSLEKWDIAEYFRVVGTHALYAYEAEAGVRFVEPDAMATKDVDLLWDNRKRLQFVAQMSVLDSTLLGVLQKIDPTFQLSEEDRFTAINADAFQIDIIRREAREGDDHPLPLTEGRGEEFFAVQALRAGRLLSARAFSTIIVDDMGRMANMTTIAPVDFSRFKEWMSAQESRDTIKRRRDALQAVLVHQLVMEFLPQWKEPAV